jgi:hypothetical protein
MQNIEQVRIYNILCITRNIITYMLLRRGLIIVVHRKQNVQVMRFETHHRRAQEAKCPSNEVRPQYFSSAT